MSLGVVRVAAVALGIGAFLSRFVVTRWVEPVTDQLEPAGLGLLIQVLALLASVLVPLVVFTRSVAPLRLRPATFQVDAVARRFVVGAFPRPQGVLAIALLWFAGGLVVVERGPDRQGLGFNDWPSEAYHAVLFAVVVGSALAAPFVRRVGVVLEPTGISVGGTRGDTSIDWDDLAPGGPPPPAPVSPRVTLYRRGWSPGPGGAPYTHELPVGLLNVQPDFLAAAIREYVEHPPARAGIGTVTELARLRAGLPIRSDGRSGSSGPPPGTLT